MLEGTIHCEKASSICDNNHDIQGNANLTVNNVVLYFAGEQVTQ